MTIKDNRNVQGAMDGNGGPNDTPTSPAFLAIPRTDDRRSLSSSDALSDVPSDVIIKERIHNGGRWTACKGLLTEYSKSTSIHGIRYLFEVHRPIYEKIFWLVTLSTSLYFGSALSRAMYRKWQDSPVILALDDTLVPLHQIPFPTVTICPETKIADYASSFSSLTRHFVKQYYNLSDEPEYDHEESLKDFFLQPLYDYVRFGGIDEPESEERKLSSMAAALHICDCEFFLKHPHLLRDVENPGKTTTILYNISNDPFFGSVISDIYFNGDRLPNNVIFQPVATVEGICFQFNGMAQEDIFRNDSIPAAMEKSRYFGVFENMLKDLDDFNLPPVTGNWSLEDGYVGQGFFAYPKRTVFASISKGLQTALSTYIPRRNSFCPNEKIGFKMYLNSPESIPQTSGNYIQISPGQEVIIGLIPQYVKPTPDLRDYEPSKRQCYFNDERYLRLFRQYSQSNCQTECLVNFTIAQCGCAQFWMPKPKHVSVCGVMEIGCYRNAQTELNLILQTQTVQSQRNRSAEIMCDCMPACTTLDYNFEISRARYDVRKLMDAMRDDYFDENTTLFKVYFKEPQFMAIKRTELFSVTSLIANYGSICGLLMGISGLSLVELVYFVSLRLYNNLRMRRVSKKKLEKKLKKKLLVQQILVTASPSVE